MDGSWSVGSDDFETAKRWLISVTSGFDVSSHYSQVGVVQYSDTPRLEIPLGLHKTTQDLIKAIEDISYLGGNTQTGRAIKFAVDHVFASSQRSEVKNRIAVVVTDGKSQDDVMDASVESRAQGIKVFAVGVGAEITTSELVTIANKPEGEYVLYAEDYTNIDRIRDAMEQKLCEGKICMRKIIFKVVQMKILGMKIHQKAKKIQGSLVSEAAYLLDKSTDITENTREIFPEGLPPSYVFVSTLRLKGPSSREKLDLWRVLSKDGQIQAAVTLNGLDKSVIFTSTNTVNEGQIVTFDAQGTEASEIYQQHIEHSPFICKFFMLFLRNFTREAFVINHPYTNGVTADLTSLLTPVINLAIIFPLLENHRNTIEDFSFILEQMGTRT
uniref:VWFA domain-containing protein n=1 Tax=Sinocyclocheilus rhinocerous TaxID=307959 RepID=A0A673LWR4_9TELE